jgi:hypothetical protein
MCVGVACERAIAPTRNRLADLRAEATKGFGAFHGRVRILDPNEACHRSARTAPGVTIELGLWDGIPAFYRDTITRQVPSTLNEPRFQSLATTTSDREGKFAFLEVPRGYAYAVRAIPPRNSRWKLGYGGTLYGPPTGKDLSEFPIVCVEER